MREVTLQEVLLAREARARTQRLLQAQYALPVLSFTMNIAGPVKNSPLIRRSFGEGKRLLEDALKAQGMQIVQTQERQDHTGNEAVMVVRADPYALKNVCVEIEAAPHLGRLLDMDVIDAEGRQVSRQTLGIPQRGCLVCGAPGRACASRRLHTVDQLQSIAKQRMEAYFWHHDAAGVVDLVSQSLLEEVLATPKPGLVDRRNTGSHRDMDVSTFCRSIDVLSPYWLRCLEIGRETEEGQIFRRLRVAGLEAERKMLDATGGVNTHKGAIFLLGIVCGALGKLWRADAPQWNVKEVLMECSHLTADQLSLELETMQTVKEAATNGQRLYAQYGLAGARGEMRAGLPSVGMIGIPAFRRALAAGHSRNDAAVITLLYLMAQVEDTNMVARGGLEGARYAREHVRRILEAEPWPDMQHVQDLDDWFIERNLSPGGCADLLAATMFLNELCFGAPSETGAEASLKTGDGQ